MTAQPNERTGFHRHPLAIRDSDAAVVVRVDVERTGGVGPWIMDS